MRKELYRAKERREGREADAAVAAKDDGSDGDSDEGNTDETKVSTRRRPTEHELLELNMGGKERGRRHSKRLELLGEPASPASAAGASPWTKLPPRPRTAAAAARPSSLSPPPGWEPAPTFGAGRPPALVRLALGLPASAADVSPSTGRGGRARPRRSAPPPRRPPCRRRRRPRGRGPPWRPAAAACGRAAPPPATRGPPRRARRAAASSRTSAPLSSRRRV